LVPVDRKDLVELLLDDNALDPALQTQTFVTLPRSLQIFSCQRCGLQLDVAMIFRALGGPGSRVAVVGLAMNEIMGTLPSSCFAWTALEELGASNAVQLSTPTWPLTLQLLDLSGNRGCQCAQGTTSCAISAVFIWLLLTCYGAFVPLSSDQ
jgi:hypothetical protein